ncbi:MAG: aldehyde dehydrogenase family protein [Acidobacteriota bacterium]
MSVPIFRQLLVDPPAPAGERDVTAPYDGAVLAKVETSEPAAHDRALATAASWFAERGNRLNVTERCAVLRRAAELMQERFEDLAVGAAAEGGKPLEDSRIEVARAIDGLHLCIETIRSEPGDAIPMAGTAAGEGRLAVTTREPIGIVVAVSAFNHPLNLIVHQVGAAVAAGCPVVVKPADDTPLSCLRFVAILHEAGLPPESCQAIVSDSLESAEKLVTDERVDFFSFIGSARVGWMLRSKLSPGTRCALEHGGAAPLFLAEDADLDVAVESVAKGGFYHAGQVCVSVQRVFADATIARPFAERLATRAGALRLGDPTDPATEVGPLIRPREVERVAQWVDEALAAGAERLVGGEALSDSLYPCTVLYDPPADAKVTTQEIFGPVVCVVPYEDLDAAIDQANSLPFAFQGAVLTGSVETAMRVYRRLDASAIMVNDHTAFRIDGMPFAGLKQSGLGIGGIPHTIRDMSFEKMLVIKSENLL